MMVEMRLWIFRILKSNILKTNQFSAAERWLRLLHSDKAPSFEKLLEQDKSVTTHTRNLQILATEMFKVYRNISLPIFSEIFHRRDINYNLRINSDFAMPNLRSVFNGSEGISYLGLKIWDIKPLELKELTSVVAFKKRVKEWTPKNCPCRLCKKYVPV